MDINKENLFIIGVIGGIASGKSTFGKLLQNYGVKVINADGLVYEALQDPHVKYQIIKLWGRSLLVSEQIDRKKLASIVFPKDVYNRDNLEKLENILHPIVRRGIKNRLEELNKNKETVLLDVPLLIEGRLYKVCDVLVFIDSPLEIRKVRACKNRNWTEDEVLLREQYQKDIESKKSMAHFVVKNKSGLEAFSNQVSDLWKKIFSGEPENINCY